MFSYDEYLKWIENRNAAPRANDGQGYSAISRPVFDEAQQSGNLWNLLGNLVDLQPGDPMYDQIAGQLPQGSDASSIAYGNVAGGKDPTKTIDLGNGEHAWGVDNSVQHSSGPMWNWLMLPLLAGMTGGFGLGEGGGLFGGGEAGLADGGAFDMGGSSGFGGSTPLASGPQGSYWSQVASNGSTDGLFGGGEGLSGGDMPFGTEMPNTYAPGADPTSAFGLGDTYYTPGMGQGLNSQTWMQRLLGPLANPSELPAWAMENPGSALRAIAGIGSLVGSAGGGGSGAGSGGGMPWANGQVPTFNPQLQPFQQNQHLNFNVPFMRGY